MIIWLCRWFVLKQGKIFWFKSDIVTPVRDHPILYVSHLSDCPPVGRDVLHCQGNDASPDSAASRLQPLTVRLRLYLHCVQDSIPRGVIEVRSILTLNVQIEGRMSIGPSSCRV